MVPIPDPAAQEAIAAKLDDFAKALERHPNWTPPRPHPGLLHVWDFVKRSHYIMTEIDNIRHGRPLKYPDQIPAQEGGEPPFPLSPYQGSLPERFLALPLRQARRARAPRSPTQRTPC